MDMVIRIRCWRGFRRPECGLENTMTLGGTMRWEGMVRPVGEDILMVVVGEGKVRLVDIFNKLKG